jgi:large subunit ribosomal protein L17
MRHKKHTVRFGRQRSHYKATLRHLASALILHKRISTTKVKAKEASRFVEKLVTAAKKDTLAARRKVFSVLRDRDMVSILFKEIAPLFKERNGGYTRVMLNGWRHGDNAEMAILEFVEMPEKKETPSKKKGKEKLEKEKTAAAAKPEKEASEKEKEEPKKEKAPSRKEVKELKKPKFFKKIFGRNKDM